MRVIAALTIWGLLAGVAMAAPVPSKIQNATYFHKTGTNCQTHCYTIGNQQHCNTTCF
jgi:hypothetical protein